MEDVGALALGLAVAAPIFLLLGLNLRVVRSTDAADDFTPREYLALRFSATSFALVVSCLVPILVPMLGPYIVLIAGISLAKAAESFVDLAIGRLQLDGRFRAICGLQLTRGIAALISFSAVYVYFGSLELAVFAWAGTWVLLLIPVFGYLQVSGFVRADQSLMQNKSEPSLTRMRALWFLALPLGVAAVLDSLILNAPRYFLQAHLNAEAVGIFSAVAYIMFIGGVVVGAVGYVVTPRLAKIGFKDRRRFIIVWVKAVIMVSGIGLAGVLGARVFGDQVLVMIYSSALDGFGEQLELMMWAALFWYLAGIAGCALNALRQFQQNLLAFGFGALAGLALSAQLIPDLGIDGAINAILGAMIIRFFVAVACVLRALQRGRWT